MSFAKDIKDFTLAFNDAAEDTVRGTTIKLWGAIVDSSPVDEGRFRANWIASFDDTDSTVESKDKGGDRTKAKITSSVLSQKDYSQFTLTNNLPYGEVIEFGGYPKSVKKGTYLGKGKGYEIRSAGGYSKQAAQGVVRVNIKSFNALLESEAKKRMPK